MTDGFSFLHTSHFLLNQLAFLATQHNEAQHESVHLSVTPKPSKISKYACTI